YTYASATGRILTTEVVTQSYGVIMDGASKTTLYTFADATTTRTETSFSTIIAPPPPPPPAPEEPPPEPEEQPPKERLPTWCWRPSDDKRANICYGKHPPPRPLFRFCREDSVGVSWCGGGKWKPDAAHNAENCELKVNYWWGQHMPLDDILYCWDY
ncbi:MAG: hypothetical protein Q9162_007286, partial [Coniocarpon cinnabarinum]